MTRPSPHTPTGRLRANEIGVEGAKAIAAVLKDTQISTLRCALPVTPVPHICTPLPVTLVPHICTWPIHKASVLLNIHLPSTRSLNDNEILGPHPGKDMSAVLKLAEVLPQSQLQSLMRAATQNLHSSCTKCSAPDEHLH